MKRTNTYAKFEELHQIELDELKQAVKEFGGEVHFGMDYVGEDASGTERPMVCVNRKHSEGPEDVYINACRITEDDRLEILAATMKWGDPFVLQPDEIEFGHISFITDLVPIKETTRKIWLRLGVTIHGTPDEMEALFDEERCDDALRSIIQKGQFTPDGESYIPSSCVKSYNMDYDEVHEIDDYDFNL